MVKEICEVFSTATAFEELEERIQYLVQDISGKLIKIVLEEIDLKLSKDRDKKRYKNLDKRERTLITTAGEINFNRRYYRDQETGKNTYLLDELPGIKENTRASQRMERIMLEMGVEMPFRRAAGILGKLIPGISAMKIWKVTKEAGENVKKHTEEMPREVFEDGIVPKAKKKTELLNIETDGVLIKQQNSKKRHEEVKLIVAYDGKEDHKLKNRCSVAGIGSGEKMWEEASARFSHEWQLNKKSKVKIGGDGATWVKAGTEMFPESSYYLDLFHLRKKLTEGLGFSRKHFASIGEKLAESDLEGIKNELSSAGKSAETKSQKKKVRELTTYLLNNWEGISNLPKEEKLGAIEGQVRHTIARRMKRIGARWSPQGTEHMAKLLAANVNKELENYAKTIVPIDRKSLNKILPKTVINPNEKINKKDWSEWLTATIPAIDGPHADRFWVKHVLRELTKLQNKSA